MEEAGFGSSAAAPVVRRILDALAGVVPMPRAQSVPPLSGLPPGAPVETPPPAKPGTEQTTTPDTTPDRTVTE
jgi:hypothetical protein